MPRVRTYERVVGDEGVTREGFRPANFGEGFGPGLKSVGRAIAAVGQAEEQIQEIRAEDEARQLDLEHMEVASALRRRVRGARGIDANLAFTEAERELKEREDQLVARASNPLVRNLLQRSITTRSTQERANWNDYAFGQEREAADQAIEARSRTFVETALDHPLGSEEAEVNRLAALNEIGQLAERQGWAPGRLDQERLKINSGYHASRIDQLYAATDVEAAEAYLNEHRGEMTGEDEAGAVRTIRGEVLANRVEAAIANSEAEIYVGSASGPLSTSIEGVSPSDLIPNPSAPGTPRNEGDQPERFNVAGFDIGDGYGARRSGGRTHSGLDMFAPQGTAFRFGRPFRVVESRVARDGKMGNMAIIEFADGTRWAAGHLPSLPARGDYAAGSDVIRSGATGNASGGAPHIHIRPDNDAARSIYNRGRRVLAAYLTASGGAAPESVASVPSGGNSRGERNNNPGNLVDGPFARRQPGYTGSDGRFARFSTPEQGVAAQETLLRNNYLDTPRTVQEVIDKYTPANDPGNSAQARANYVSYVQQRLGVSANEPLTTVDAPRLAAALREFETGNRQDGRGGSPPEQPTPVTGRRIDVGRAEAYARRMVDSGQWSQTFSRMYLEGVRGRAGQEIQYQAAQENAAEREFNQWLDNRDSTTPPDWSEVPPDLARRLPPGTETQIRQRRQAYNEEQTRLAREAARVRENEEPALMLELMSVSDPNGFEALVRTQGDTLRSLVTPAEWSRFQIQAERLRQGAGASPSEIMGMIGTLLPNDMGLGAAPIRGGDVGVRARQERSSAIERDKIALMRAVQERLRVEGGVRNPTTADIQRAIIAETTPVRGPGGVPVPRYRLQAIGYQGQIQVDIPNAVLPAISEVLRRSGIADTPYNRAQEYIRNRHLYGGR